MSEWRETTLGNVLTLQRGFDLPGRDRIDGPYPIVSSSGVTGHHAVAKVAPPGVVIGRYGSLGSVHWITEPYWPHNTALWVKDFKGNDPRFISYLLRTISHDGSAAAAVPGVNRNHLHRLLVRVPNVSTQRRISGVLSTFDDLVAINERRIELLENLARSLYREWFVRFRFPDGEKCNLVGSDLGPIPEAWSVATLARLAGPDQRAISSGPFGSKLGRKDYVPSGVPVIRGANLDVAGMFRETGFVYVSEDKAAELSSSVARPGDIVVTQRGTLGQVGLIPMTAMYQRYVLSQSQMKITIDGSAATREYIFEALRSREAVDRIHSMAISAGVPHINLAMLRELKVVQPPQALQDRFSDAVRPIAGQAETLRRANTQLAAIRDAVLPRLVTGRVSVSDIDLGDLLPPEEA